MARKYRVDILEGVPVARLMIPRGDVPTIVETWTVQEAWDRLHAGDPHRVVLSERHQPVGVVAQVDLPRLAADPSTAHEPVGRHMDPRAHDPRRPARPRSHRRDGAHRQHGAAVTGADGILAGLMTPDRFLAAWAAAAASEERRERGLGRTDSTGS